MIKKFLYQLDVRERKVVTAIVEDNNDTVYIPDHKFPMQDRESYIANEEETVTRNNGEFVYVCFDDEDGRNYLDINTYGGEVKISLTNKIAHASCFGKDFMSVILDYVNYFDYEEVSFISSGMSKNKRGETDIYDNFFRKVTDASYVKLNKNNTVYFLTKTDDYSYVLTEDFTKAVKVPKDEVRKVLVMNKFIDSNTAKQDLSFSQFKCLTTENGYIYGGFNLYKMTYVDRILKIDTENVKVSLEDRLINSEDVFLKLKDVSYLLSKEKTGHENIVEANAKYVKEIGNQVYQMFDNPYEASLIDEANAEIIRAALKVFSSDSTVKRHSQNVYLYYVGNVYSFYDEPQSGYEMGKIITVKERENFIEAFDTSFNTRAKGEGIILIKDDKYLNIEIKENHSFAINFYDSAYNASIFTTAEANAIVNIFKWDVSRRELQNLIINGNLRPYNITYTKEENNLKNNYQHMLNEISDKKHRMCGYEKFTDIKVESEKGSLEYLRRFYVKDVLDNRKMFSNILELHSVKNILIVGSKFNLELIALNDITAKSDQKINITTINETKQGYLPKVVLNNKINYVGSYKLKFQNLPASFLKQFDMIVFGKGFNEEVDNFKETMDSLIADSNKLIITNLRTCKVEKTIDSIHAYFKDKVSLKRKYFNHTVEELVPYVEMSNKTTEYMRTNVCKCSRPFCVVDDPYIDNEYSYHSVVIIKNKKVYDFFNK